METNITILNIFTDVFDRGKTDVLAMKYSLESTISLLFRFSLKSNKFLTVHRSKSNRKVVCTCGV